MASFELAREKGARTMASILGKDRSFSKMKTPEPSANNANRSPTNQEFGSRFSRIPEEALGKNFSRSPNEVPEKSFSENSFSKPVNQSGENLAVGRPEKRSSYQKGTLAYQVSQLRDELIKRATDPIPSSFHVNDISHLHVFQEKFSKESKSWKKLMNRIIYLMNEIDGKYKPFNYFDLKDRLLGAVLNIAISYILIGKGATSGYGIGNPKGGIVIPTPSYLNTESTIDCKIQSFLEKLPDQMESISVTFKEISRFDNEHSKLLHDQGELTSHLEALNKTIRTQENDLRKLKDDNAKRSMIKSLEENRKNIILIRDKLDLLNERIEEIITKKDQELEKEAELISDLFDILRFNYFMHDSYSTVLDYKILPTNP